MSATTVWEGRRKTAKLVMTTVASRTPANAVSFTLVAVATAFGLLLLPSSRLDAMGIAAAGIVAAGTLALSLLWRVIPEVAALGVPLGFVAVAALLRDAAGGSTSGFGGLLLLPVLWLAVTAGRRELGVILAAMLTAQLVPIVVEGSPGYPVSTWRGAVILTSVAAVTGLMVQRLVDQSRSRAAALQEQAARLERVSARLADQNQRLLEVDRMKDEFIALVSHELRTPLTSISGYLEMALDPEEGSLPPSVQRYLSIAERNVERLAGLVNQLLFLVRADSHRLELDLRPLSLGRVVREAAETARPAAEAKEIELEVAVERLPPVLADRTELLRLVDNLVSNAVRFTAPGGRVRLVARRDGAAGVVEVTDTGIGIPADELPRLFERFFRASSATDSGIPGTGLGLAISQLVAEAHGTAIEVESTLGKGSTFRVVLPPAG